MEMPGSTGSEEETVMHTALMPAAFVGHGSPMNTIEHNSYTELWQSFAAGIPRPKAILAVSAHWYINATAVTAMAKPRVIHDFYGFPQELFDFDYPAPGSPELAAEIVELVKPTWVGLDLDSWGLDHGTWSVLAHMFPEADIPVVQLSVNGNLPLQYHVDLGAQLHGLRERGVLVLGSGNVVHNLGRTDFALGDTGFDWAHRFDDAVRSIMTTSPADIARIGEHPDFRLAAPTPDHLLPLLYTAGMAAAANASASVLAHGYTAGSLSMTSYGLGLN